MIVPADSSFLDRAAEIIRSGGLVAIPTETVYGLGADALNPAACARIFAAKKRPFFDPLIVHISDIEMLKTVVSSVPEKAQRLMDLFWPGPLTFVLPRSAAVPDIATSGLPTVAVRMPAHPAAREIIRRSGTPIAAPSANPFGYISPTTAAHVEAQLGDDVDLIIDGGSCSVGVESTIVSFQESVIRLLRPGGISREDLESAVGEIFTDISSDEAIHAPGMLDSHYAPKARLVLISEDDPVTPSFNSALLSFRKPVQDGFKASEVLSVSGDLSEAAVNLFAAMRRLDESGAEIIYAHRVPEHGLGDAVMNRLRKAAAQRITH